MPLTITRSRVKEKCSIADSSFDTTIDNLLAEMRPVLEFSLQDSALASPDSALIATLNLGATEIVCGEFLAQRLWQPGVAETVTLGDLRIQPSATLLDRPALLIRQGYARLQPFMKTEIAAPQALSVLIAPMPEFSS